MGAIQDVLKQYGDETVKIIQGNLARTGTNASGETSRSLLSVQTGDKVTVSGKEFIFVVETGRRPGRMPPTGPIAKWIQAKGLSIDKTVDQVAFAIAVRIAEAGTKLFQSGGRDDIITPAISDERLDKLTSDVADIELGKTLKVIDDGIADSN